MRDRSDFRPAQVAMVEEMTTANDGVMVLGMGGGKTVAFLTAAQDLIRGGSIDRAYVLAPPRTLWTAWGRECAKWKHLADFRVQIVDGTPAQRAKKMAEPADVYVISIDITAWFVDHMRKQYTRAELGRFLLGIDEISKFKGNYSKRAKKLQGISQQFDGRWGLTGTPRHNGYIDLYNPLRVIGGDDVWGPVGNFEEWRSLYFRKKDYMGFDWEPHPFAIDKLKAIAQEWLVYAPVDDLDLPPLNTGDDFVRHVELTEEQRELSKQLREEMIATLLAQNPDMPEEEIELVTVQAMSQGVVSGKLVQVAQGFLYDEKSEPHPLKESPKLDMLLEMDQELGGERAVITYGLRAEIPVLEKVLKKSNRIARLGGGVSPAQAGRVIDAWMAGKIDRLLLHPASAGHGVDGLQEAGHHMIHFHPTWSAEMYDQVIKRLHRPGQKHEVFNWWIMADGSVDEIKYARVENKLEDAEAFKALLRRLT